MTNKTLTLSIVIPAYNEENYLRACLDSIAGQSVMPEEVIVVDNNSSDNTRAIAKSYGFVKLVREKQQHQSFAQKTGFDLATSDIIGRIDADSVLPTDWVQNVKKHFSNQPELVALSGGTLPYDMAAKNASSRILSLYLGLASRLAGVRMLWGANCALRRSAWQEIRHRVLTRGDIWEDFDLSFCLAPHGEIMSFKDIDVASSFRAVHKSIITQTRYQFRAIRTFHLRTNMLKTATVFCIWSTMYFMFLLVTLDRFGLSPAIRLLGSLRRAAKIVSLEAE